MIRSHVMALRMALPSDRAGITHSRASGYRIHHEPGDVDVHLFERRIHHGRELIRAGRHLEAVDQISSGLQLWRSSTAMADVQDVLFLQGQTVRLHELRLQAEELLAEARLQCQHGDTQLLVPGLMHLAHLHPFRERLLAQLMIALYASGRRIEALGVYTRTRRRFIEDAGIEPSEHLQRVHEAILKGEEYRSIIAVSSTSVPCA
jgi:DNA-binding SARP family transcriptional activator